jgi:peptidoglycan/xylan/chitin deacetylase (PgdA/CDA1 family)
VGVLAIAAFLVGGVWLANRSAHPSRRATPATTQTTQSLPTRPRPRPHPRIRAIPRLALPSTPATGTVALPILMYHRIDALDPALPSITLRLTVAPADFAAQMRWLKQNGYHAVTQMQAFDALERGRALPPKPVLITFDDGYRDVIRYAAPLLHRLHMPATAYVITDRISGPDTSFFTWGQLKRLERLGVEIGSHTVSHPDLTILPASQALAELHTSRRVLEKHLGHPVQWLAYPAGAENASVVELARRAGYVLAVTTNPGTDQDAARPLELNRYEVLDTTGVTGVAALLGAS